MSTHEIHEDPAELEASIQARYELRDGNFWSVGKYITGFFIFSAIAFALAYFLMLGISATLVKREHPINLTVANEPSWMPEKAPLQNSITTATDMKELRAKEQVDTEQYGKPDAKGKLHIPVDAAIEKLGAKGTAGVTGGGTP
jgi:hypothetical protein